MVEQKEETQQRFKIKTMNRLEAYGKFGESFDKVINNVLDENEELKREIRKLKKEVDTNGKRTETTSCERQEPSNKNHPSSGLREKDRSGGGT